MPHTLTLERMCFLHNMEKLCNLCEVFRRKRGKSNCQNDEYGDCVENDTFNGDFMVEFCVKLVWSLSGVFMEKTCSSELRPGFQGKIRILHIYASLMLFPQAIRTKLRVQVDDGHRYGTGL